MYSKASALIENSPLYGNTSNTKSSSSTPPVKKKIDFVNIFWEKSEYSNPSDPRVWGPSMWLILHTGSANYPVNASPIAKEKMKSFILGLPMIIPCETCSDHATVFIQENWDNIDDIVSGRQKLFNFFCEFHNKVNKRYNKPVLACEDAMKLYTNPVFVKKMKY